MLEFIKQPWPWYVGGVFIGLIVPTLLLFGKQFGISSSLRHICAACLPSDIPFFKYDWKKESWNLFFVAGILIGGFIGAHFLSNPNDIVVAQPLKDSLAKVGIDDYSNIIPGQLFNFPNLLTLKGFFFMIVGGFLVGFGTRYAGGCTSGHSISGLSNLQWPSLVATICFMVGGFICANFIVPYLLQL